MTHIATELAAECRGVTKDFGSGDTSVRVLRGIDLEVPTGEITLLVGPSGCGKTTLISIICGLLRPTAGEVTLFGVPRSRCRSGSWSTSVVATSASSFSSTTCCQRSLRRRTRPCR